MKQESFPSGGILKDALEHLCQGDGGGQPLHGTFANRAKGHDPREDSPGPAETSVELVAIFPVAAADVQTVVGTTLTDLLQLEGDGKGRMWFSLVAV